MPGERSTAILHTHKRAAPASQRTDDRWRGDTRRQARPRAGAQRQQSGQKRQPHRRTNDVVRSGHAISLGSGRSTTPLKNTFHCVLLQWPTWPSTHATKHKYGYSLDLSSGAGKGRAGLRQGNLHLCPRPGGDSDRHDPAPSLSPRPTSPIRTLTRRYRGS
jgi:hypothetical protein